MYQKLILLFLLLGLAQTSIVKSQVSDLPSGLIEINKDNIQQLHPLQTLEFETINDIAWSHDGKNLAVATETDVFLYEFGESFSEISHYEFEAYIHSLTLIPHSSLIAINQFLYDTTDFTLIDELDGIIFDTTNNGELLALAVANELQLYDLSAEEIVSSFVVDSISFSACETSCGFSDIAISPNNTFLAFTTAFNDDGILFLEGLENLVSNLDLGYLGLRFSPSESILVSWEGTPGFFGERVILTSVPEETLLGHIEMRGNAAPDFSGSGDLLIVGGVDTDAPNPEEAGGLLAFFDLQDIVKEDNTDLSSAIKLINVDEKIFFTEFSPKNTIIAVGDESGILTLWGI